MSSNSSIIDRNTIHVVQHLIEKCLLFYMDLDECVACLEKNANLKPAITRAVWDELEKANVEFFAAYATRRMELQLGASTFMICRQDKENQQVPSYTSSSLQD